MSDYTVRVDGLREFQRATAKAERETKKRVRERLAEAGEPVRREWAETFARIDSNSAAGLRVRVRQRGISVEQSKRRSKDPARRRPQYAEMQLAHGERALEAKSREIERAAEEAVSDLRDIVEGRGVNP